MNARSRGLPRLRGYAVKGFLASSILVLLAGVVLFILFLLQTDSLRGDRLKADVAGHLAGITTLINQQQATLAGWAKQPELREALQTGDPNVWKAKGKGLTHWLADALQVRLFPADLTGWGTEDSGNPPLRFAGLDQLRRASRSSTRVPAEVHLFATPQQHYSIVQAVSDHNGTPIGVIMANFPLQLLTSTLSHNQLSRGRLELQQTTGDGIPLTLASLGSEAVKSSAGSSRDLVIPGTRWRLVYWHPPRTALFGNTKQLLFLAVILITIGLLALLFLRLHRRLFQALRKDQITLINVVEDAINGHPKSRYPVQLEDNRGTVELIAGMAREFHAGQALQTITTHIAATRSQSPAISARPDVETISRSRGEENISASIFRAYDIRGVVGETLTPEVAREIGQAVASEALEKGENLLLVGRDGRLSSQELAEAMVSGIMMAGCNVVDIGMVPTPVLYFGTHYLGARSGVMVTGSHNPINHNGFKIVIDRATLYGEALQALRRRIDTGNLVSRTPGTRQSQDLLPDYLNRIASDINLAQSLKVVIDCGNGATSIAAPDLLQRLGCQVTGLFCEVDGTFPNHHPNPSRPENLQVLQRRVVSDSADIGIAFDGDGDRLVAVDSQGRIIWPDRLLMLFARDVLSRQPGSDIIFDIKSSRHVPKVITSLGGRPHMWKTGHSILKARVVETGAPLGGELSGHIFFQERWYGFDDGLYGAARLLEILSASGKSSAEVFDEFPNSINTPELEILMTEGQPARLMEELLRKAQFPGANITTMDGLRVDFEDAWGLIRASNTTPCLCLRFEADTEEAMARIQDSFRRLLLDLEPDLLLPF